MSKGTFTLVSPEGADYTAVYKDGLLFQSGEKINLTHILVDLGYEVEYYEPDVEVLNAYLGDSNPYPAELSRLQERIDAE